MGYLEGFKFLYLAMGKRAHEEIAVAEGDEVATIAAETPNKKAKKEKKSKRAEVQEEEEVPEPTTEKKKKKKKAEAEAEAEEEVQEPVTEKKKKKKNKEVSADVEMEESPGKGPSDATKLRNERLATEGMNEKGSFEVCIKNLPFTMDEDAIV